MVMRALRMSASSNADYQACQRRYQLSYVYELMADQDKDSTRVGSTWHKCHELLETPPGVVCPRCEKREEIDPNCYLCDGTAYTPTDPMNAVVRYLNHSYVVTPDNKTRDEWELERTILLYSLSGHRWLYAAEEDRWEIIGSEIKFEVPVINPVTNRKLPKVVFVGKIDRLVRDKTTGLVYVWERKSTGRPLNDNYWTALAQGDQISGYIYGSRAAQKSGLLEKYGISPDDDPIAGAFCDVWHKPDIAPKRITKADLKTLQETGTYCGIQVALPDSPTDPVIETPEMFGARLLFDISERPQHYFQQREVCRTDPELEVFQERLFHLAKQIRTVERGNLWVNNLGSCENPFWCEFRDLCRSGVPVDADTVPVGYKKKFQKEEVQFNG